MQFKNSRKVDMILNRLLNDFLPPVVRDCRWIFWPLIRLILGKKAKLFFNFRDNVYDISESEFTKIYSEIQDCIIDRPTDLNEPCINAILNDVVGSSILEVGCGRGFLAEKLKVKAAVTASDVVIASHILKDAQGIIYRQHSAENLPYEDRAFDTVVSTHTLEHVRDLGKAIYELRRVCARRLIIVLPCERPYRWGFNLHIHFFPYAYSVYSWFGKSANAKLTKLSGDWYYVEEMQS